MCLTSTNYSTLMAKHGLVIYACFNSINFILNISIAIYDLVISTNIFPSYCRLVCIRFDFRLSDRVITIDYTLYLA